MFTDLRLAWRSVRARPGETLLATCLLTLGAGFFTAIFALADAALFRSLPYDRPDQLVFVWDRTKERPLTNLTPGRLVDLRERMQTMTGIAGIGHLSLTVTGGGAAERLAGASVSSNFFDILGAAPAVGRVFREGERDRRVVVLSHGLWQRRFGGDAAIVGGTITLDGRPHTVLGVMRQDFHWPTITPLPAPGPAPEIWVLSPAHELPALNIAVDGDLRLDRRNGYLRGIARVKPDATIAEATAEAFAISRRLAAEHPGTDEGRAITLVTARQQLLGHAQLPVLLLAGTSVLVLLGACVNVGNLTLMRLLGRRRDLAVQAAIGASRLRILIQVAAESTLIAGAGGVAGLVLAAGAVPLVQAVVPIDLPRLSHAAVDVRAAAACAIATTGAAVAIALLQAGGIRRLPPMPGTERSVTARLSATTRGVLVASQLAIALVLVTGAALFGQSFRELQRVDVGIADVDRLLTFNLVLSTARGSLPPAQRVAYFETVIERLRALPGVERAATAATLPIGGDDFGTSVVVEGGQDEARSTGYQVVGSGWFETLGIPVLRGRDFTPADDGTRGLVVMVNAAFAERHWPGHDPIGRRLRMGREGDWMTVIGLVADIRHLGPKRPSRPEVYEPQYQRSFSFTAVAVRAAGNPLSLVEPIRTEVARLDPEQPISSVATMGQHLSRAQSELRSLSSLTAAIGAIALSMAALGVYGAMAFGVAQRRREFGVRLALGATGRELGGQVLREALLTAAAGLAAGGAAAAVGAQAVRGLLFETAPGDPVAFGFAALTLLAATVVAAFVPARTAMRTDPSILLRAE